MTTSRINKILSDTAYQRLGGSAQEKKCADYLANYCKALGLDISIEAFDVKVYDDTLSRLTVDGVNIPSLNYHGSAEGKTEAELIYLDDTSELSLKKCKSRIVLVDKGVGKKLYQQLCENGALGFITFCGDLESADSDIYLREIRYDVPSDNRLFCVNINIKDAFEISQKGICKASLEVKQKSYSGKSHNVVVKIPGQTDEQIVVTAHYDSTYLSEGAYDNMSGCIALLHIADSLKDKKLKRGVTLVFCGSEERGLLGSLAYCKANSLNNVRLNINLDMLGSKMGGFVAFSCANEDMLDYLEEFLKNNQIGASVRYGIRSSDSNSFVKYGIPAVSFARYAPSGFLSVHTKYDTRDAINPETLMKDSKIIAEFTKTVASLENIDNLTEISEKIRNDVEEYFN